MQKLLENKKFLKIMIFVTTLAVLIGVVFLIYFKDQPKIIPEETRGEVREAVAEEIVKPIAKVAPVFAKKIENASFDNKDSINKSVVTNGVASATANWPTYKNEELGFELKYPEGWVVAENNEYLKMFKQEYRDFEGSEFPYISMDFYDNSKDLTPQNWLNENYRLLIGDQTPAEVVGFLIRKNIVINNLPGVEFTWENMGETKTLVFAYNEKIIVYSLNSLGRAEGEYLENYEGIINSIK